MEDDAFDIDYHLRHTVLPRPGTEEQMRNDVARLHDLKLCLDEVYEEYRQALVTDKGWCCLPEGQLRWHYLQPIPWNYGDPLMASYTCQTGYYRRMH